MSAETLHHASMLLRVGAVGGLIGSLAFFLLWEGGNPLVARTADHVRHAMRNLVLFVVGTLAIHLLLWAWLADAPAAAGPWIGQPPGLLTSLEVPTLALVALGLIAGDLAHYLFHRLCHRWRWLWLVHAVHHSDPEVDVTTSLRFHPVETALELLLMLGVFVALGIPLWVLVLRAVLVNPFGLFQHANVVYPAWIERGLRHLIVTPSMHRLHHSPDAPETNSNFGQVLSVWDRLLGTYRDPRADAQRTYGLRALANDTWQSIGGMLATPVRARGIRTF